MDPNASNGEPTSDNLSEIDALLREVTESLEQKRGRVVIFNDDHNSQTAVIAAVAGIVDHDQAGVSEDDHPAVAQHKVISEAQLLTLLAEKRGHQVVFEGDLASCDEISYELTRGDADRRWFEQVSRVDPYLIPTMIVNGFSEGLIEMDDPRDAMMSLITGETDVEDVIYDYLTRVLPRPKLTVKVVEETDPDYHEYDDATV